MYHIDICIHVHICVHTHRALLHSPLKQIAVSATLEMISPYLHTFLGKETCSTPPNPRQEVSGSLPDTPCCYRCLLKEARTQDQSHSCLIHSSQAAEFPLPHYKQLPRAQCLEPAPDSPCVSTVQSLWFAQVGAQPEVGMG